MIYPIVLYGNPILRKCAENILPKTDVAALIADMYDTMHTARGVGLAAPQIGKSIRLFIVDGSGLDDEPELKTFKKVFINPTILSEQGQPTVIEEGCLSIPGLRENVTRPSSIHIHYFDENWHEKEETFSGFGARIIQHEYDHLEGILFIDHLSPIKKKIVRGKLRAISKGDVDAEYRTAVSR